MAHVHCSCCPQQKCKTNIGRANAQTCRSERRKGREDGDFGLRLPKRRGMSSSRGRLMSQCREEITTEPADELLTSKPPLRWKETPRWGSLSVPWTSNIHMHTVLHLHTVCLRLEGFRLRTSFNSPSNPYYIEYAFHKQHVPEDRSGSTLFPFQ